MSSSCRPLLLSLSRYASARIRQYEGVDRPSSSDIAELFVNKQAILRQRVIAGKVLRREGQGGPP